MPRSLNERDAAPTAGIGDQARWVNDKKLAAHFDVSIMTLYRWQNDPELGFPKATRINGLKRTNVDLADSWMREYRERADQSGST